MLGVVSVIAFRLILIATMFQATKTFPGFFQKYARVMATGVAAFINAIIIEVFYLKALTITALFLFSRNILPRGLVIYNFDANFCRLVDLYFKSLQENAQIWKLLELRWNTKPATR